MKTVVRWLIYLLLYVPLVLIYITKPTETEYVQYLEVIDEEGPLIRWKQEDTYVEESMEVFVQPLELDETNEPQMQSLGVFMLTAYCPCTECSDGYGNQTAIGGIAVEGRTVAVDPTVIPYGTVLIINDNEYVAEDCGAWIQGNDIDIYFESHEEADKFGVQYMEVFTWQ